MLDHYDFPNAIEMEKQLLSAMLLDKGFIVPKVLAIINADDLYRPEHQFVFNAIVSLYSAGKPVDFLTVEHELQETAIGRKSISCTAQPHQRHLHYRTRRVSRHIIKEKADLRRLIVASKIIHEDVIWLNFPLPTSSPTSSIPKLNK